MRSTPAIGERPAQERVALGEPGGDERVLGLGSGATRTAEVAHQLVAQLRRAAGIAGAERRLRCRRSAARSDRAQSARGNAPRSGIPGRRSQVMPGSNGLRRERRALGARGGGDPGRRALGRRQVALGGELTVSLEHDAAGDTERVRECA